MKKRLPIAVILVFFCITLQLPGQNGPDKPPVAKFKANKTTIEAGESVDFMDQSLFHPDAWYWTFEGGIPAVSEVSNPQDIQYLTAGSYDVTLIVVNEFGADTLTKENYIEVVMPDLPEALFTAQGRHLYVGDSTGFKDHSKNGPTNWQWLFEGADPPESVMQDPDGIVYNAPGTFDVTLIVGNAAGYDTLTKADYIMVSEPLPPVADFEAEETEVEVGETVEFEDKSENNPETWHWFFEGGEPAESMEEEPEVVYHTAGTWDVTLIVINEWGADTLTKEDYITVIEETGFAPVADFEAEETEVEVGETVEFEDKSENDPETWHWFFEGGEPAESMEAEPEVVYHTAGTWDVTLIVTNEWGADTLTKEDYITVIEETGEPPVADFTASATEILAGETIDFTDLSLNDPDVWLWAFEGGIPVVSPDQNPTGILYEMPGTYDVMLIVANEWGADTLTREDYITVTENLLPEADFVADKTLIDEGEVVHFTDLSTGNVTGWEWHIEGATPSVTYQQNPVVIFNTPGIYSVTLTVNNNNGSDTEVKEDHIEVSEVPVVLPPGWEFSPTGVEHIIAIPLEAAPTVMGLPIAAGDHIGVFFTDDQGEEACGGAVAWTGTENVALMAIGDDLYSAEKDGFATGETFIWKIYSWAAQQEYAAVATYDQSLFNQGDFAPLGMSAVQSLQGGEVFELTIPQGWSGISTPLVPLEPNMENLLDPILQDLVIINNFTGVNWPGAGLNTLYQWDNRTGYTIKVQNEVTFPVHGVPEQDITFNVEEGWNYLPALTPCGTDLNALLDGNLDKLEFVREVSGFRMFWPEYGINSLSQIEPGDAYLILANTAFDIAFPECTTTLKAGSPEHVNSMQIHRAWNTVHATGTSHSVAITGNALGHLKKGDVIGVFTQEGLCAGTTEYNGSAFAIQAFGDDITTPGKDGFEEFETFNFKLFRETGEITYELTPVYDPAFSSNGQFEQSGISVITDLLLEATFIQDQAHGNILIYPNPSDGFVRVSGIANCRNLVVEDMKGSVLRSITLSGEESAQIDLSDLNRGVYILRIQGDGYYIAKRLIKN